MAQNVEQVAPDAVVNTPRGKMVDFNKLAPAAVAGLGYLNQKVNSLGQLLGDRRVAPPAAAPSRGYSITEDERAQLQKTKAGRAALGQLLKQHRGVVEEEGPLEATYRTRRPMPPGVQASVSKSEDLPKQARWLEDEHKRQWQRFNARPAWERELLRTRYGMRHGIAE
jgi:hypothetical protein